MRVGLILAALFLVLSSSATILAFSSRGGENATPPQPSVSNQEPADSNSAPQDANVQDPPATPDDNGCTTENESGPGYNRSTVTCKQEVTTPPQSSSGAAEPPAMPAMPDMPAMPQLTEPAPPPAQAQIEPQPATPAEPQAQAAPQSTTPGDADPACVTEQQSGDGWNSTTVRCIRQSVTAGSSTSVSSVTTSQSSVSVSTSNTSGTR